MPLYDYTCNKCGEQFEALVLKQLPAPKCPKCQATDLEQMISRQFAVDSESKREATMAQQRKKNDGIRREYEIAQKEYEKNHKH